MASRSVGSFAIQFGLVTIPVKMYSATDSKAGVSFKMLAPDGKPVNQVYVHSVTREEVARDSMLKGYEFSPDQFVTFTKDEIKAMQETGTGVCTIDEFVPVDSVDPVFFEKPYYLAPDKVGAKAYALILQALQQSKRCGIGRWAARGRQHVVMIREAGGKLMLQQLLYRDEVRDGADIVIPPAVVSDAELNLALQIIGSQSAGAFDSSKYHDEVEARIVDAVQKKVSGQEFTIAPAAAAASNVVDLMAALTASLAKAPKADAEKPAKKERTKRAA